MKRKKTAIDIQLQELEHTVHYRLVAAANLALKGDGLPKDEYGKWHLAFDELLDVWGQLRRIRTKIRAKMRETKPWFQDACPHEKKRDARVRYNHETRQNVVELQVCEACGKGFVVNEVRA